MTASTICVIVVICYSIIAVIIGMFLEDHYEYNFSEYEIIGYPLCWPLFIILLSIFFIIKIIKRNIKIKEANKLEEYRRKKETVYTVLKELKIR
jgi:uncharacterized membrane protein